MKLSTIIIYKVGQNWSPTSSFFLEGPADNRLFSQNLKQDLAVDILLILYCIDQWFLTFLHILPFYQTRLPDLLQYTQFIENTKLTNYSLE